MSKTRRHFSPEFKARVVLVLLREDYTVYELVAKHQISPAVLGRWKAEFLENATEVFKKQAISTYDLIFTDIPTR